MKFFQPSIALMNRLKYPQKFGLIGLVFCLPLVLVLFLLFSEIKKEIDFTQNQKYGIQYLRPLNELFKDVSRSQQLSYYYWQQNLFGTELQKLNSKIDLNLQSVSDIDRKLGKILNTTEQLEDIQKNWYFLQENRQHWSIETQIYYYDKISDKINRFKAYLGDTSNLIIDPELDTYYLIDATFYKLPEMQKSLADIKMTIELTIANKQFSLDDRKRLIVLANNLRKYHNDLAINMNTALNNNRVGNLKRNLASDSEEFLSLTETLVDELDKLSNNYQDVQPINYMTLVYQDLDIGLKLGDKVIDELDFLLQRRIDNLVAKQQLVSGFVFMVLAMVIYLFVGFYLNVKQTVSWLDEAAKQMASGKLNRTIALESKDELAEIVESFNKIAAALVEANSQITDLNECLKADNLRMSDELKVTRKLQEMILPKESELRKINDLDIAGFMEPAKEVGGDYYDVLHHNGLIKIGIGDVTGHGLESGVLMIMVQTAVRTLLENNETNPVKFLNAINRTIYDNVQRMNSDKNLTLSLLDYQDGTLRLSGQHEEMIVVRQGGKVELINTLDLGFPIGLEADITDFITYSEVSLQSGDVVILYTDGVTEAENIHGVQYGLERLCHVVSQNWYRSASEIRQIAIDNLKQHIGKQIVYDDITLLVLKQK